MQEQDNYECVLLFLDIFQLDTRYSLLDNDFTDESLITILLPNFF